MQIKWLKLLLIRVVTTLRLCIKCLGTGPEGRESCEYAGNTRYSGTVVTRWFDSRYGFRYMLDS
jgi:hypothetical protein